MNRLMRIEAARSCKQPKKTSVSISTRGIFPYFFVRENAIKPAFLLSFWCIYEKSCLISCGLGAAARVLGHNGPKVLLELILTKSLKGLKSYRLYCFSHFLQIQDRFVCFYLITCTKIQIARSLLPITEAYLKRTLSA